ncbi:serine/threonine-protein kinase PBL36-like [Syzygium oleosum]|uniref:serine/threonine-protein kinase PBL36-like n=1 Tax=Syzygium oleosum TaxID=219896 RepID=UPI0024B90DA8|nr:serine/threonine-protein kinase PBL36-like [Syzygium oleosum]
MSLGEATKAREHHSCTVLRMKLRRKLASTLKGNTDICVTTKILLVNSSFVGCVGGTLPLPWSTRMKIALDAAKILAFLHEEAEPQVLYRNFKTSKILLDADYNVKLTSFGVAKSVPEGDDTHFTNVKGTITYIDPEHTTTGKLTVKSDVYGFGAVLLEIVTGRRAITVKQNLLQWARPHLGEGTSLYELMDSRLGNQFSEKGAEIALQLAARCLSLNRKVHPRMTEVVEVLKTIPDLPHMASTSSIQNETGKR